MPKILKTQIRKAYSAPSSESFLSQFENLTWRIFTPNILKALECLRTDTSTDIAQWADENRFLSSEDSAEPGRWRTDRAEFQRGIMECMTDQAVEKVVFQKSTQVGWTAILGNVIGYYVDRDPCSLLMIQPTVDLAKSWSKERLDPMIRDTPVLRGALSDNKRDADNTLRLKIFQGGFLAMVGANAPSGLASRPIRIVLADEVDRWPASAGDEGDPLWLASRRQATFWNRKTLIGSTPTVKDFSVIEREFLTSDQRFYYVPCPECGEKQRLVWEQVKFQSEGSNDERANSARYQCNSCGELWNDVQRDHAVKLGEWISSKPFNGTAGFHISHLYSPWVSFKTLVKEFLDAQANPEVLKVWTNTSLAETWEEKGERANAKGLGSHIEEYGSDDLPDGVYFATMGVDVQKDRLEYEIVGWGKDDETWGIEPGVIMGDPAQGGVWNNLDEVLSQKFWTVDGRMVRVRGCCIDSGGHHQQAVLNYVEKKAADRFIFAIKGAAGSGPVWPKRASKSKDKKDLYIVRVDAAKEQIYSWFKVIKEDGRAPKPGYCHFSPLYDDEWFQQATSETVITKYKSGRPFRLWVLPNGKRNEGLDCRVYAYASRMSLPKSKLGPGSVRMNLADRPQPITDDEGISEQAKRDFDDVKIFNRPRPISGRRMRSKGIGA